MATIVYGDIAMYHHLEPTAKSNLRLRFFSKGKEEIRAILRAARFGRVVGVSTHEAYSVAEEYLNKYLPNNRGFLFHGNAYSTLVE